MKTRRIMRAGRTLVIEYFTSGRVELYNLSDDLGEKNDLAEAKPEKARELRAMLADWRRGVGARMPKRHQTAKHH